MLPLCLLTPNMQYRRIVDSIFRGVNCAVTAEIETDSLVNMCAHVRTGHWSTVVPQGLLNFQAIAEGAEVIPLVEPEISHTVGLVASDRDPPSPLAAAMFALAHGLDIQSRIEKPELAKPSDILQKLAT